MLVALSVPARWRAKLGDVAEGSGDASRAFDAPITGGNLTTGTELTLTITVLGHAARPLARDGARPGDALYVTGTLGGPGSALRAWESGREPLPEHRARFAHPMARIAEARWLAAHGATAAIDISDGLVADVRHLASASGVEAHIELDAIPVVGGVSPADAAVSGEEYELAIAAAGPLDEHAFAAAFGVPLTRIGSIVTVGRDDCRVRVRSRGTFVDLPAGHDHFSS
jgi:thiamine-monophosphate kinase